MHAGTRHAQIKLKKSPKPTETRISQNEKNQKNHNLANDFRTRNQSFHQNFPPNLQKEQSAKKNNFGPKWVFRHREPKNMHSKGRE